jgi:hypothetical protein
MIVRACIICTTSIPENSSYENWKQYSIQGLRQARAQRVSVCETCSASAIASCGQNRAEFLLSCLPIFQQGEWYERGLISSFHSQEAVW